MTRSPAQGSACKDLGRNGQARAITPKATYTPIPNRADSRSLNLRRKLNGLTCLDTRYFVVIGTHHQI
ncbi:hypothetical protein EFO70_02340 [Lacticaseibacillus rhamnosus]|nr:hypothetical protein [Lacticaseibacillus rhamnosus]MCT3180388.1 hypothetical protein [Lacticaseibacillus rhamnosus]